MKRIKAAFRTNEPQVMSVCLFTCLNLIAYAKRESDSVIVLAFAVSLWPVLAFVFNLIDPIPEQKDGE